MHSTNKGTIATTSMGRNAAVMLHLVSQIDPSVPTIWVDTGYNLRDTYVVAERLIRVHGENPRVDYVLSLRRRAAAGRAAIAKSEAEQ